MNDAATEKRACSNCGAALQGEYCSQCGQHVLERPDSLKAFVATGLSDFFSFRSRTLRSLVHLVTRPGALTAAYVTGKRARYTQPIQLYLIAAALFFLANSYRPFVQYTEDNRVVSSLSAATTGRAIDTDMLEERGVSVEVFRERFRTAAAQSLPQFMIGSILLFALTLALFSPRRPALMHVVFALHWTGLFMLVMAVARVLPQVPGTNLVDNLASLLALIHLMLSLRHAYSHSRTRAILSGLGLFILFNAILVLWVLAVGEYAIRQAI